MKSKHPMQPLEKDKEGTIRFKQNKLVNFLLEWSSTRGMNLNDLAIIPFSDEDRCQFAQLIGYSTSGYAELHYVSDEDFGEVEIAEQEMT